MPQRKSLLTATLLALGLTLYARNAFAQSPATGTQWLAANAAETRAELNAALANAIWTYDPVRVKNLLQRGADPNTSLDGPPILLAIRRGDQPDLGLVHAATALEVVTLLLKAGADQKSVNDALPLAARAEDLEVCRLLLTHHAPVDTADAEGVTSLLFAASRGNQKLMDLFLAHKANPNAYTETGVTPLAALILGTCNVVSSLISTDHYHNPNRTLYKALIDKGANLKAKTKDGDSLFALAIGIGNLEIAHLLLERGADINERGGLGYTPLLYAVFKDQPSTVRFLLANGADPNRIGPEGTTPLMTAVYKGNIVIVRMLLAKGATPSAQRPDGQTALKSAQNAQNADIVKLLTAAGAKE